LDIHEFIKTRLPVNDPHLLTKTGSEQYRLDPVKFVGPTPIYYDWFKSLIEIALGSILTYKIGFDTTIPLCVARIIFIFFIVWLLIHTLIHSVKYLKAKNTVYNFKIWRKKFISENMKLFIFTALFIWTLL
jgi:hypothetical protein